MEVALFLLVRFDQCRTLGDIALVSDLGVSLLAGPAVQCDCGPSCGPERVTQLWATERYAFDELVGSWIPSLTPILILIVMGISLDTTAFTPS